MRKTSPAPDMNSPEEIAFRDGTPLDEHLPARDPRGLLALNDLIPRLYEELRVLARRHLAKERGDHLLQTTALVHEAYMRMSRASGTAIEEGAHFLAAASLAMRRILVEEARAAHALKRGGHSRQRIDLSVAATEFGLCSADFLALHEAMEKLSALDVRKTRVVELRFFGGLSVEEVAGILKLTTRSVERDWQFARAWLYRELTKGS